MKLEIEKDTLRITAVKQLGAANASAFREWITDAFIEPHKNIDIDLSETTYLDSCGLGALVSLHKTATDRHGIVRLLNPLPPVRQILELTRMDRILDILKT